MIGALNQRGWRLATSLIERAAEYGVVVHAESGLGVWIDLGVEAAGGLNAGRQLAEICMAGLGEVSFTPCGEDVGVELAVRVVTDHPVAACLASQYAGWKVAAGDFFAMGSGPMRAAIGKEELFDRIGFRESSETVVGVLETRQPPPKAVFHDLSEACSVSPEGIMLLVAPTASQAGAVQITARSVETALHKLVELEFDVGRIESAAGLAPLAPVGGDDLAAIGRTNDAILYGGRVTLWLRGDDASLAELGPKIPSSASADHGRPFAELFARYDHDFYRIDPMLFSPAQVTLVNLDTGRSFHFGETRPDLLRESFAT